MRVESQDKQTGLSKVWGATFSAIVAMVIASVALFIPNARLWTVLLVGILVFLFVLFIILFNRYLWMARTAQELVAKTRKLIADQPELLRFDANIARINRRLK